MREVLNDLWILIRDYAKQETVDPLMRLKRFFAWGFGGAVALTMGLGFGALAIIRCLQTQTGDALTGSLDWVPYLVAIVFTAVTATLCAWWIKRPFREEETVS